MVLPGESYFREERVQLEKWSACLIADLRTGKSYCEPHSLDKGFPFRLFGMCIIYALGFLLFVRRFIAVPIGRLALTFASNRAPLANRNESRKVKEFRQKKFIGSFVECWFYTASFVVGSLLLRNQSWVWPSSEWWKDTPTQDVDASLMIFSLFYAARYCASFFSLVILEPRKKDFVEMAIHHFVTVLLVCLAVAHGYVRIALVIMVLFDAADPFLHAAKLVNYVKQAAGTKGPTFSFVWTVGQVTDALLACFAVVFTVTRIFVYSYVVYSVSYESYLHVFCWNEECSFLDAIQASSVAHHVCVLLVWIINGLQWYWFRLLLIVIYRSLVHGETDDARSDLSQDEAQASVKSNSRTDIQKSFVPEGTSDDESGDEEPDPAVKKKTS